MASIHSKLGRNGKKTYFVVVSQGDKRKWIKAGSQQNARFLKREIDALTESQRIEKLGLTAVDKRIDDFFGEYLEYVRLRAASSTVARYSGTINTFITFLQLFLPSLRLLSELRQEHIELYQQKRLESAELKAAADGAKNGVHKKKRLPKPQTVNFEVGLLHSAFLWAFDRELILKVPTRKVKKLRVALKKTARILAEEECRLFITVADEIAKESNGMKVYALAFQFLLNTGLRSGELCNLTWNDIEFETGLIHIRAKPGWTPKTSERAFYLNKASIQLLRSIERAEGFVFLTSGGRGLKKNDLRDALIMVAEKAGIKNFTRVHDLRHTFSSLMQMKGVDPGTVAAILGHRKLDTTAIYTHQTAEHLKKSIERINTAE